MIVRSLVVAAACWLAAGCAPKVHVENPSPFDEDDPAAGGVAASSPATPTSSAGTTPEPARLDLQTGTVQRDSLVAVLDRGPAAFLGSLELAAEFAGNRFTGWRIVRFSRGNPLYYTVDLRPGDIIRTVNQRRIERPNQLETLWKELRTATEIVVEAERGGRVHTLRFTVVDAA